MVSALEQKLETLPIQMVSFHMQLVIPEAGSSDTWEHDEWKVTLSYEGRQYTTSYKTGLGHRKPAFGVKVRRGIGSDKYYTERLPDMDAKRAAKGGLTVPQDPKIADVLSSLLLDASGSDDRSFEEWCDDFGYDADSRKALEVYLACQKSAVEIRRLLGTKLMDELSQLEH